MKKIVAFSGLAAVICVLLSSMPGAVFAQQVRGGSETIKVSKCYYDLPTGQMLIKATSSISTARLYAYRPDGTFQGEVQNGGGSRYGGTVMGWIPYDPGTMTIKSSAGASVTVPTTPFQP